jgi:Tol biopolymer transport system component
LNVYRIEAFIGAGGMGDVYRARDTHLGRDVALKVLPPELASDAERVRRFEQEARAIAALNHPNIVTLYSVEEAGGLRFLTMELVEGTPLSEQIPRAGLPLDRLLDIGVALTDGLATAHARGIVHRDLKPANVMVTREGRVKILDFGLAKLKPVAAVSDQTTTASPVTSDGQLLGTVAYMSPEQAEGRDVDHRSDIFSFGVMLYELATGHRPFKGDSTLSLLSAILRDAPALLTELKPEVPRELARVVRRCLAKDPERRCQSAKDVRNELEELRQEIASGGLQRPDSAADSRVRRWRSLAWIGGGIGALATIALVFLVWRGAIDLSSRPPAVPVVESRVVISVPVPASVSGLSVSLDGTQIAFVGGRQLWRFDLADRTVKPVAGVGADPRSPFWSPDGKAIAYFQGQRLMRIPAEGSSPTKICDLEGPVSGGTWGAENTIVFGQQRRGLFRVSASGGVPVEITKLRPGSSVQGDYENAHMWPQFLPDGRRFTYTTSEALNKVYIGSLDPRDRPRLVAPADGAQIDITSRSFAFSGFLLTAEEGTLRARPLSTEGTNPAGAAEVLAQDISGDPGVFAGSPAVLAYVVTTPRRAQFSIVDRGGRELRTLGPPVLLDWVSAGTPNWSLSRDGRTLAFTLLADDRSSSIQLLDLARDRPDRFASGRGRMLQPVWSPESDRIVFTQDGIFEGAHLRVKGVGKESDSPIAAGSPGFKAASDWHGQNLLFTNFSTGVSNFWHVAMDGTGTPELWFQSGSHQVEGQFSADGRWAAYASRETGVYEVYLRRFPSADGAVRVSGAGGSRPLWRPDGKGLFYVGAGRLMEVDLDIGESVKPGTPRERFPIRDYCGYAVMPDGRFVVCRRIDPVAPPVITIVLNWAAGLKKQ